MDSALDQIAAKCGSQLRAYQNCVAANRGDWGKKCQVERQALSDCSEENVSALKNIKRACSSSIDKYDSCLAKNKSNPLNCIDILRELTTCVDAAAKREGIIIPQQQGL